MFDCEVLITNVKKISREARVDCSWQHTFCIAFKLLSIGISTHSLQLELEQAAAAILRYPRPYYFAIDDVFVEIRVHFQVLSCSDICRLLAGCNFRL